MGISGFAMHIESDIGAVFQLRITEEIPVVRLSIEGKPVYIAILGRILRGLDYDVGSVFEVYGRPFE